MNQVNDHQELLNWKKYLQLDMSCFLLDAPRYQDSPLSHQKLTKSDQASSTINQLTEIEETRESTTCNVMMKLVKSRLLQVLQNE